MKIYKNWLLCPLFLLLNFLSINAQVAPKKPTSADIYDAIRKLNTLGSVLYVAAHPDDENTRLIAYMANEKRMHTTYLSLTRGDGGQNLIGTELREMLGVLRTQELLMARSVDGGKQLFSRANDFGFSKSPAETMAIWNKKEVLSDVVWAIRKTQPDIIINRFSQDTTVDTHGHHTSSAILSEEAFNLAADPSVFPEQLKYVHVWQPKRLFFNTSWFFYGSQEKFEAANKDKMLKLDIGVFYPTKGKSNNEIAAESRSMHKCQGMGMLSSRGSDPEYLDFLKGPLGKPTNGDPLQGINTTWNRLGTEGGEIGKVLEGVERNFKFENPAASVPALVSAMKLIEKLNDPFWKEKKLADIKELIRWCSGLYLEVATNTAAAVAGQSVDFTIEAVNRSTANVKVTSIEFLGLKKDTTVNFDMTNNIRKLFRMKMTMPNELSFTSPYWLKDKATLGLYRVDDQLLRGLPETPRTVRAKFNLVIEGLPMTYETDIVNRYDAPAKGELYRPFEVTPSVFVNQIEKVYVFGDNEPKEVGFVVKSGADGIEGMLKPEVPNGWTLEPQSQNFKLKIKGEETVLTFKLTPPKGESEANIISKAYLKNKDNYEPVPTNAVRIIEYDHIPTQTVLYPSEAKVVKLDIKKRGINIGYVMGAGDDMPACLEQIGYQVTEIKDADFQHEGKLQSFDAIVVGIRAYNTKEKLKFYNEKLLKYVENGGTMVVQYNTAGRDLQLQQFGPYPFKLGRGRTTEEDAPIRVLKPEHPVMNIPNKITQKDFNGWVQERGLYFLSEWDSKYEAILSCNDTNEKPEDGGLVVAKHGKGWYVYTGYSFFRELPAGVSGAYRLFANLLSLGKALP
ncbi:MAG: PIG-L family deacetylase [Saprospiraceae bacterium]|nr:PIG-L family deacetylase [Saprospiraceae bacterium]